MNFKDEINKIFGILELVVSEQAEINSKITRIKKTNNNLTKKMYKGYI